MGDFLRTDKARIQQDIEYIYDIFPRLKERENQLETGHIVISDTAENLRLNEEVKKSYLGLQ